ncbi:myosin heavy chain-like protein [Actinidia rufa]|uniref:Myosin heavy chain-like protein n=1 Tax=Actinidia rufa TaxID=165716 RepID=A0A7J0EU83_9ERIC|nr:myosin heavy chain-like protein [Actinidia rufa]
MVLQLAKSESMGLVVFSCGGETRECHSGDPPRSHTTTVIHCHQPAHLPPKSTADSLKPPPPTPQFTTIARVPHHHRTIPPSPPKNLLEPSSFITLKDSPGDDAEARLNYEGNVSDRRSNNMDIARMKNENATLKESLECMEHLTSAVRRLRLSLLKVKELVTSEDTVTGMAEALEDIVTEAKLVKTALGSSLPVGWSAEADVEPTGDSFDQETICVGGNPSAENVDFVSAAGFEMVEVLILAAHLLEDHITSRGPAMEVD